MRKYSIKEHIDNITAKPYWTNTVTDTKYKTPEDAIRYSEEHKANIIKSKKRTR